MQLPSRTSRWESIPTRQNPRFPRNVHRAKRGPPKPLRRHSSHRSSIGEASLLKLRNELNEQFDHQEGNLRRTTLLDGLVDNKIRFDRKGNPIIIVRRSTTTTACSDLTFESGCFSDDEDDFDDFDFDDDISEEASLVDDDDDSLDDESEAVTVRLSNTQAYTQAFPELDDKEDMPSVPRILILGLEPRHSSLQSHPSRQVTEQIGKQLSGGGKTNDCVEVDTAVILTDAHIDDDSRNDEYILAMASLNKQIQRSGGQPNAILVITEDSDTSDVTLEGYHVDQTSANTKVFNLLEALQSQEIPVCAKPIYGLDVCRQWSDRFQKSSGFHPTTQSPPIIFFHLPARTPETAIYHYQPYLTLDVSVKGVSVAVSALASHLAKKNR